MLVNMNEVLKAAQKGKYAVGLFNAVNLELARGIIAAAEQKRSPVINKLFFVRNTNKINS